MSIEILREHQIIWQEKPVLRAIYHDYYQRIASLANNGSTLEVGGGIGNLKNYLSNVISADIIQTSWLDISCNAESLPFENNSFDNIIAVDVLHHLENPMRFFREAKRVLKFNGKIILLDPAITIVSWFFYHFFHPEPVILNIDPFKEELHDVNRQPFDANQAIPGLIFDKFYYKFKEMFPELVLLNKSYLSLWAYPLSGGFRGWSLLPAKLTSIILKLERYLERFLGKYIGFRILIVLQKVDHAKK